MTHSRLQRHSYCRSLLIDLNEMGLGVATEALDPIMPQYLGDRLVGLLSEQELPSLKP